ncbi:MAG: hypothetical protein KDC53_19005 [Saprospiraceae bacterium]|nr:hypothetical protein [Saprospiraceae bacterium]
MKTALLICDHVSPVFVEKHGTYPVMYQQFFKELVLEPFFVCDDHFPEVNDFDLFIITGSRYSVYDAIPWITRLKILIREIAANGRKCIGVCFGHQIIAEALDGKVKKASVGYLIGVHTFRMKQSLYDSEKSNYNVLMLCQDQVSKLPSNAKLIAGNDQCPVGMYVIGNQFFAIQGHPEFTKDYDRDVFLSRREKMGDQKIEEALQSLEKDPDTEWLYQLMMKFVRTIEAF